MTITICLLVPRLFYSVSFLRQKIKSYLPCTPALITVLNTQQVLNHLVEWLSKIKKIWPTAMHYLLIIYSLTLPVCFINAWSWHGAGHKWPHFSKTFWQGWWHGGQEPKWQRCFSWLVWWQVGGRLNHKVQFFKLLLIIEQLYLKCNYLFMYLLIPYRTRIPWILIF